MSYIDGAIKFALKWEQIYVDLVAEKIRETDPDKERAIRLSPKSHIKAITNIQTGFFFAGVGKAAVHANGEVESAFLVDGELEDMQQNIIAGLELSSNERKTVKQRIQTGQLSVMSTLEYFGLFEVQPRKGPLSNKVNWYIITEKGREILAILEGDTK